MKFGSSRLKAIIRTIPWILVVGVLCPRAAEAQLYALPSATVSYGYNSNVFAVPTNFGPSLKALGLSFADHSESESAAVQLLYNWGFQELYANAQAQHVSYDQDSELNHNEFLAHVGTKWRLGTLFDGVIDYQYQRNMVQFLEFTGTELLLQHDNTFTASANLQVTPEWRLESQGQVDHLDSPRPGLPDLNQSEDRILEKLRYSVATAFTAGLNAGFIHGHFSDDESDGTPEYDQYNAEAAATYNGSEVSSVDGSVGYTRRTPKGFMPVGGVTGKMDFSHQFSDETSISIKAARNVNTYVTYVGTEVDTSVTVGGIWRPTEKIAITPSYEWLYASYPQTQAGIETTERADHYQLTALTIKYQLLNWLAIIPFGRYETRGSNINNFSFNRTAYGISIELRLSGQADQPYELTLPD